MFKTALNKNIIPHIWKLANIVPIPKPNKDTDKGTSYRPISLLSVIAKTLEKSLLPYITGNIPNTPMQHGYKTQHYTVTALHTLNNTVAKGFNQMAPPARTITVALDMSKAFDTINIHTLIRKLLQTNIPGTIIKFIANYIKRRKAYTTYRNHTSKQRQFKTGVPQGGLLSPTLFNIYTSEEITSDIQKHKQNIWKEHLDAHWDHRHNTHTLWKTIHGLSNRAPPHTLNTSITFNNKIATTPTHIANCFTKQFTNTIKHATHKTNRHINRATYKDTTLHSLLLRSKRL